ncbi:hypothetical protein [Bifidobacterium mongoliense]|uniref:hypothetical protein n=1 Tax=Bifidobacterium mongoliense TaxID=518643 RepID=UPI002A74AD19|nr:hypothetical protein [Bifidobacterium mongoliense]
MSDVDPYLIPGTGVLRNLVNAHSGQALNAAENDWVTFRFLQLQKTPLTAEGDGQAVAVDPSFPVP